jgi:hypothetical protein
MDNEKDRYMITEEDKVMLKYFWEEKEDIERYCNFEKIKPELEKKYPEILRAWNDYQVSKNILSALIKNM